MVGARPRIESFSVVSTDAFGNTTFLPRANRKLLSIDTAHPRDRINDITNKMSDFVDNPALWVGDKDNSATIIFGILGDFAPEFGVKGSTSFTNYEIKGLT